MRAVLPILLLLALPAGARDVGQFGAVDPATRDWFRSLTNQTGAVCCDQADGHRIEDPDWRIEADGYAVRLDGQWQRIPPELVVRAQNRIGVAVVWLYPPADPKLRCFMPGATG